MTLNELQSESLAHFRGCFGRPARWVACAPGRVNLIGEHVDYNGGFVLPMAIDRYAIIAADANDSRVIQCRSTRYDDEVVIPLDVAIAPGSTTDVPKWAQYVRGVVAGFVSRGVDLPGCDLAIHGSVPLGGGLSSSAALEVAVATVLEGVNGHKLDPVDKAILCQRAEHEFAGMPCGLMDQFTSVMGRADHLLLLDCRSQQVRYVPMRDESKSVLIIDTRVKHELTDGGYAARRAQCEAAARAMGVPSLRDVTLEQLEAAQSKLDPVTYRRARHVVTEIARTVDAAGAIEGGDWEQLGELMYASHASLHEDYEVSCAELDVVVETARSIGTTGGVIGCRMTGGGFGGCAVAIVETERADAVAQAILTQYKHQTGIDAAAFVTRPVDGAAMLSTPSHGDGHSLPLLAEPTRYRACDLDLRHDAAARRYWLDLYHRHMPGALDRAVSVAAADREDEGDARVRAAACLEVFNAHLAAAERDFAALDRLDVHTLAKARERILREHGFTDAFRLVKEHENETALRLLPGVLAQHDARVDPDRATQAVRGVFAGNIFDVGATATLALFESGKLDFQQTLSDLKPRPWFVDHLDAWVARVTKPTAYKRAMLFVDNAGCDVVLGMIPFARDLLQRGTDVVFTANTRPALNDITHTELVDLIDRVAEMDPVIAAARDADRIACVPSGNASSLIDLGEVSDELIDHVRRHAIDLVVLEGMGRALESNFNARFTCDALKLAMVKDPDVARELGAAMYDLVLRFDRV